MYCSESYLAHTSHFVLYFVIYTDGSVFFPFNRDWKILPFTSNLTAYLLPFPGCRRTGHYIMFLQQLYGTFCYHWLPHISCSEVAHCCSSTEIENTRMVLFFEKPGRLTQQDGIRIQVQIQTLFLAGQKERCVHPFRDEHWMGIHVKVFFF